MFYGEFWGQFKFLFMKTILANQIASAILIGGIAGSFLFLVSTFLGGCGQTWWDRPNFVPELGAPRVSDVLKDIAISLKCKIKKFQTNEDEFK